jgi:hypothetical protein
MPGFIAKSQLMVAAAVAMGIIAASQAHAGTDVNVPIDLAALDTPAATPQAPAAAAPQPTQVSGLQALIDDWYTTIDHAKATQPEWSSPLITTTSMLEQRYRFDIDVQHAGNGADTTILDGGKGFDLIVSDTEEIQVAAPPYDYYSAKKKSNSYVGFGDWPFFRFKQRIISSPQDQGNYILSAWVQVQAPVGIQKTTNHAFVVVPTIGFGKGFGPFDIQGTVGASIPTAYEGKLGTQVQANLAFQLHLFRYFWPQVEFNSTYWSNGTRNGLDQVFVTPGVVIGRIPLYHRLTFTVGVGYQQAIAPTYQAKPITPQYDHAWVVTTRFGF